VKTNLQTQRGNDIAQSEGGVWYQLRSEREEICEALIKEPPRLPKTQMERARVIKGGATLKEKWRSDLLQARKQPKDLSLLDGS
jgi:hypothetical protein